MASTSRTQIRPEIQALRALAVVLVLTYHLWPRFMSGGFVGVDVFFVISGFLITSHLLREVDRTGSVSLISFWARRARRILPAAFLVLLICAVATLIFVPWVYWGQFLKEIESSVLYIQNWNLADNAVDYLRSEQGNSLVTHFWSLSVEEQFYLVWPLLIILGAALVRFKNKLLTRRSIWVILAIVTSASLLYSIYLTAVNPAEAYFVTFTRAWEFGAGGLLAFVRSKDDAISASRSIFSWVGLTAIIIGAFYYSDATSFPGYTAVLPIVGTVVIIWAGMPKGRLSPGWLYKVIPIQFLGDISYSVYLWHWPLIILFPFIFSESLNTLGRIGVVIVTVLLAWLTKIFVEDPVRTSRQLKTRRAVYTFASALLVSSIVFSVALAGSEIASSRTQADVAQAARFTSSDVKCFGAAARDSEQPCHNSDLDYLVIPSFAAAQTQGRDYGSCSEYLPNSNEGRKCNFGTSGVETVALIGDSHARHWLPAFTYMAKAMQWNGVEFVKTACSLNMAIRETSQPQRDECNRWKAGVISWLKKNPKVTRVFISARALNDFSHEGMGATTATIWGYKEALKQIPQTVHNIYIIRDTPTNSSEKGLMKCIDEVINRVKPGLACSISRKVALNTPDYNAMAAHRLKSPRIKALDLTKFFCNSTRCFEIIGGVLVHRDSHHITNEFSSTLGPYLLRELQRADSTQG